MIVGIIDYGDENTGSGNLNSVRNSLFYAGCETILINDPDQLKKVDKVILPGVGATKHVIDSIKKKNFDEALNENILKKGKPFLGICVGMQVLATHLTEFGEHDGLGWIEGKVINLKDTISNDRIIPHMGWNEISFKNDTLKLEKKINRYKSFYFAHSYTLIPVNKSIVNSTVDYGKELVAGISFDNIAAFQFHPEKSQISGELFLKWFIEWSP